MSKSTLPKPRTSCPFLCRSLFRPVLTRDILVAKLLHAVRNSKSPIWNWRIIWILDEVVVIYYFYKNNGFCSPDDLWNSSLREFFLSVGSHLLLLGLFLPRVSIMIVMIEAWVFDSLSFHFSGESSVQEFPVVSSPRMFKLLHVHP